MDRLVREPFDLDHRSAAARRAGPALGRPTTSWCWSCTRRSRTAGPARCCSTSSPGSTAASGCRRRSCSTRTTRCGNANRPTPTATPTPRATGPTTLAGVPTVLVAAHRPAARHRPRPRRGRRHRARAGARRVVRHAARGLPGGAAPAVRAGRLPRRHARARAHRAGHRAGGRVPRQHARAARPDHARDDVRRARGAAPRTPVEGALAAPGPAVRAAGRPAGAAADGRRTRRSCRRCSSSSRRSNRPLWTS